MLVEDNLYSMLFYGQVSCTPNPAVGITPAGGYWCARAHCKVMDEEALLKYSPKEG